MKQPRIDLKNRTVLSATGFHEENSDFDKKVLKQIASTPTMKSKHIKTLNRMLKPESSHKVPLKEAMRKINKIDSNVKSAKRLA